MVTLIPQVSHLCRFNMYIYIYINVWQPVGHISKGSAHRQTLQHRID